MKLDIKEKVSIVNLNIDFNRNIYFFGQSAIRDNNYEVYLSKDLSFPAMGRIMHSLEGIFITKKDLESSFQNRKNFSVEKGKLSNFEKMYEGKFYFNGE